MGSILYGTEVLPAPMGVTPHINRQGGGLGVVLEGKILSQVFFFKSYMPLSIGITIQLGEVALSFFCPLTETMNIL